MAEVADGVTGQNQSFDVLRNYCHCYHDDHVHIFYDVKNLVVCHVGWEPCVAFDCLAQI